MRECTAHVIVLAASGLNEFLELRHDLFPAAVACEIHTETVVDLFSSVERKNDIAALAIREIDHIVVDQNAVGRKGETEVLALLLLDRSGIRDKVLYDLEIHERLTAEKVDFEVMAVAGIFNQKIKRALTDFKAHDRAVAVVFALRREAVGAVEIAGMRDMQAQRLNDTGRSCLQIARHRLVGVLRKKLSGLLEFQDLLVAGADLLRVSGLGALVLFLHVRKHFLRKCLDVDHGRGLPVISLVESLLLLVDLV